MNTTNTIRECPRCGEACEAELLRPPQHLKGVRSCPTCGYTARPGLFRTLADQRDADAHLGPDHRGVIRPCVQDWHRCYDGPTDADVAGELHARACRRLDRVRALLMIGAIVAAAVDVALVLNILRFVAGLG